MQSGAQAKAVLDRKVCKVNHKESLLSFIVF